MPRRAGGGIEWKSIFMIVLFAVIGLYLVGKFSEVKPTGERGFTIPADIDQTTLMVIKILIVGAAVFFGYALSMKFSGGTMTARDAFTVILIFIGILLLWDKVLQPILQANSIDSITFSVGQKLGVFTP